MGESKNPHFYDFGTFGRVPETQNQLCLSLATPGPLKNNQDKSLARAFWVSILYISKFRKSKL